MARFIDQLQTELNQAAAEANPAVKRMVLKEIIQSYVLSYIYNHPEYKKLNFYGGTCARVIYGLNRMSEDLDLDNSAGLDLSEFAQDLTTYFRGRLGIDQAEAKEQGLARGDIYRFTLKLPILEQLGLSNLEQEKIHVKVEISQHQQSFQSQVTPVVRHNNSFVIQHFNRASLFSGKILACLERRFIKGQTGVEVKGRDFYDLIWYMEQKIMPYHLKLEKDGQQSYTVQSAFNELEQRLDQIKRRDLAIDLTNLFVNQDFIENWLDNYQLFFKQYQQYYLE
jgi:predicted nucleotidyltransferase component of viral defense system